MAFYTRKKIVVSNPQSPVTGMVNGTNAVFTFNAPINNLYVNEGFQIPNIDYTSTQSGNTITVTFVVAPVNGSNIYAT